MRDLIETIEDGFERRSELRGELRGEVPGAHGVNPQILYRSNHYGLILEQESGRLHQVEFVAEKAPGG